jgi:hypothetical protein
MKITFNTQLFLRLIAVFVIMDLCLLMAGCGDWETQASQIISLLGPALQALVAILAALGVTVSASFMARFNSWAQQTQTALITIKGLIAQYKTASAAAQPGLLSEIQTALQVIGSQLSSILTELHITDPTSQAKVQAAFAAISAFIASLITLVPAVASATEEKHGEALSVKANETAKQFKKDFNCAVVYFGKQYEI